MGDDIRSIRGNDRPVLTDDQITEWEQYAIRDEQLGTAFLAPPGALLNLLAEVRVARRSRMVRWGSIKRLRDYEKAIQRICLIDPAEHATKSRDFGRGFAEALRQVKELLEPGACPDCGGHHA